MLDLLTGLYRCRIRSKKLYHRLFFHLVDVAVVNAWLLYKRVCRVKNEKTPRLHDFKAAVAEALCKYNKPLEHTTGSAQKRSRRDDSTTNPAKRARRSAAHQVPSSDVRLDQTGHFPVVQETPEMQTCWKWTIIPCIVQEMCSQPLL